MVDEEGLKDELARIYEKAQTESVGNDVINLGLLTSPEIARLILATNKNLQNFRKVVRFSETRHIVKRHGKEIEKFAGQVQIESEHFIKIPEIITNYDRVVFQPKKTSDKKSKDSLLFEKGKYSVVTVIVWGQKELILKTM